MTPILSSSLEGSVLPTLRAMRFIVASSYEAFLYIHTTVMVII